MRDVIVHPTACVDQPCEIGEGTRIWHFVHVMAGARIGRDCVLGQNVMIASTAVVGDRVRIQNNVAVYDGVVVEDDVFLGPSCVLTNVKNPRAHVSRKNAFERTRIGRGATIGANATIVCGHDIGRFAFVAAGAVVTHDVADYALVQGTPARQVGWTSRDGERLDFDGREARCPRSGLRYLLVDRRVRCLDAEDEAP